METLKYWCIANLEILALIACVLIWCLNGEAGLDQAQGLRKIALYCSLCFAIFIFMARQGGIGLFLKTLVLLFALLAVAGKSYDYYEKGICGAGALVAAGAAMLLSLVVSARVAMHTYQNFDEVVSRRMLWRNSNVSLFEAQAKYTYDRFVICWCFLLILFVYIISLLY